MNQQQARHAKQVQTVALAKHQLDVMVQLLLLLLLCDIHSILQTCTSTVTVVTRTAK
jgi:hypothetical protein